MLNDVMGSAGYGAISAVVTVVAFTAFIAIIVRTWTRPRQQIEAESRLWMDDESPADPRNSHG